MPEQVDEPRPYENNTAQPKPYKSKFKVRIEVLDRTSANKSATQERKTYTEFAE